MALTRTRLELRQDIARRLDVPDFSSTTFVTDTTMNRWINQAGRRFNALLIRAYGEDYWVQTQSITTVPGDSDSVVPQDYFQTLLMRVDLGGTSYKLRRASRDSIGWDSSSNPGWGVGGCLPAYRIWGSDTIQWVPTPRAQHVVTHYYVPVAVFADPGGGGSFVADMTDDTHYLVGWFGWEEHVVLQCCERHRRAEQLDASDFMQERLEYEEEIRTDAGRRDSEPRQIKMSWDAARGWPRGRVL